MEKWFICLHDAMSFLVKETPSKQQYRFFKGVPYLVKNKEDIEFFESHPLFKIYKKEELKKLEINMKNYKKGEEEKENPELSEDEFKKELSQLSNSDLDKKIKSFGYEGRIPIRKANKIELIMGFK